MATIETLTVKVPSWNSEESACRSAVYEKYPNVSHCTGFWFDPNIERNIVTFQLDNGDEIECIVEKDA